MLFGAGTRSTSSRRDSPAVGQPFRFGPSRCPDCWLASEPRPAAGAGRPMFRAAPWAPRAPPIGFWHLAGIRSPLPDVPGRLEANHWAPPVGPPYSAGSHSDLPRGRRRSEAIRSTNRGERALPARKREPQGGPGSRAQRARGPGAKGHPAGGPGAKGHPGGVPAAMGHRAGPAPSAGESAERTRTDCSQNWVRRGPREPGVRRDRQVVPHAAPRRCCGRGGPRQGDPSSICARAGWAGHCAVAARWASRIRGAGPTFAG